jgi:chitinase
MHDLKSPQLVTYLNANPNLSFEEMAQLPYTDFIFSFLIPTGASDLKLRGSGWWCNPSSLKDNINTLQKGGKNVLISFGGARGIATAQYEAYSKDVASLASDMVSNWVKPYGFDGVDIDFEDTAAFESGAQYDGVTFLSSLTEELARQLPSGQNLVTHAPQPPYWGTTWLDEPCVKIWENAGENVSWINNQFYGNAGWDGTPELDIANCEAAAKAAGPGKLLFGITLNSGTQGYLPPSELPREMIEPLQQKYPGNFGGAWRFQRPGRCGSTRAQRDAGPSQTP